MPCSSAKKGIFSEVGANPHLILKFEGVEDNFKLLLFYSVAHSKRKNTKGLCACFLVTHIDKSTHTHPHISIITHRYFFLWTCDDDNKKVTAEGSQLPSEAHKNILCIKDVLHSRMR